MRYSSGIIKPDGVARQLDKEIFEWMGKVGLTVVYHKTLMLTEQDIKVLYDYCYDMPHYKDLEQFLMSGPVIFYVVSSRLDAIESLNRLVGSTDPKIAMKETIRGRYGKNITLNVIHSTQNEGTLRKDLLHFLTKKQLMGLLL